MDAVGTACARGSQHPTPNAIAHSNLLCWCQDCAKSSLSRRLGLCLVSEHHLGTSGHPQAPESACPALHGNTRAHCNDPPPGARTPSNRPCCDPHGAQGSVPHSLRLCSTQAGSRPTPEPPQRASCPHMVASAHGPPGPWQGLEATMRHAETLTRGSTPPEKLWQDAWHSAWVSEHHLETSGHPQAPESAWPSAPWQHHGIRY